MSNRGTSRARQLSSAGRLRVSEPLALETVQRIRNVWTELITYYPICFSPNHCSTVVSPYGGSIDFFIAGFTHFNIFDSE
ncbi:hypothetical protein TNCV_2487821 [Trichonephila clavipes]|uniref:Uncharacterized protein n=1 Tax=Trichonephila clavipes TaxID=2585209 RepID=A0A8X6W097_TRICX|nr:hypothetical protein TNCV_2487821 [Trichonephila clavipes]